MRDFKNHRKSAKTVFERLLIRGSLVQAHPEAPEKESCRSTTYRIFLFLTFQICSQFVANIILFVAIQRFTFAEFVATNPAKDNLCKALSSSNVDKLKTLMGFQLSTAVFKEK